MPPFAWSTTLLESRAVVPGLGIAETQWSVVISLTVAYAASLAVVWLVLTFGRRLQWVAVPNARSFHDAPTPDAWRSGRGTARGDCVRLPRTVRQPVIHCTRRRRSARGRHQSVGRPAACIPLGTLCGARHGDRAGHRGGRRGVRRPLGVQRTLRARVFGWVRPGARLADQSVQLHGRHRRSRRVPVHCVLRWRARAESRPGARNRSGAGGADGRRARFSRVQLGASADLHGRRGQQFPGPRHRRADDSALGARAAAFSQPADSCWRRSGWMRRIPSGSASLRVNNSPKGIARTSIRRLRNGSGMATPRCCLSDMRCSGCGRTRRLRGTRPILRGLHWCWSACRCCSVAFGCGPVCRQWPGSNRRCRTNPCSTGTICAVWYTVRRVSYAEVPLAAASEYAGGIG